MTDQILNTGERDLQGDEKTSLIEYCLQLGDNALVLGHRNSEWCGHGPILEQDIALTNISLDLIGQARNLYQYAAALINEMPVENRNNYIDEGTGYSGEITEDSLAYLRPAKLFRNFLLCELPNGDWAETILRQFFFSNHQYLLYQQLQVSSTQQLAAIAEKSLKEVTYHLRWSSEWVIRLGDGTAESKERMNRAIGNLWPFVADLYTPAWQLKTREIFDEAGLIMPQEAVHTDGVAAEHTEHLGILLNEMQELPRAFPNAQW